jgi:NTP pyrophosphatase (non-canonical NTP hydrolase)
MEKENYDFLKDYSETAGSLAIYPGQGEFLTNGFPTRGLFYVCFKLMGESGEFSEKIGKCIRDNKGVIDLDREAALLLELGDVLWYLNALCREFGKKFEEQVETALKYPANEQQNFIEKMWPTGTGASVERFLCLSHTLCFHAAEISRKIQLYDRSHPSHDPDEYNIFQCVHSMIAAVAIAAHLLGNDLLWIARMNLDKLTSRKKRGKLQGEGDNR